MAELKSISTQLQKDTCVKEAQLATMQKKLTDFKAKFDLVYTELTKHIDKLSKYSIKLQSSIFFFFFFRDILGMTENATLCVIATYENTSCNIDIM